MRKLKGHEVVCPCCKKITGMSRGAHTSASESGVFIICWCDHCGEKLVVKTMDKDCRPIDNLVMFPKR